MSRYARQTSLAEIGPEGQARLAAARIAVIGAGGLAAPALQYLAGAGVGALRLVDPDGVALSNLHRQTLFSEGEIGQPKVAAAAARLRALNSEIEIETCAEALTPANVGALCEADIVLDCADQFAASYTLSDHCFRADIPLISASALGLSGYVGGFCGGAPSLRAVFPDLPAQAATCAEAGVLGPLLGLLGSLQADMAIAHLTGRRPGPLGQMLQLTLAPYRLSSFRFDDAPEPGTGFSFIAPEEIRPGDHLIELRSAAEAPMPFHPRAARGGTPPEGAPRTIFACRSGLRAWQAAQTLSTHWPGEIALIAMGDRPSLQEKDIIP